MVLNPDTLDRYEESITGADRHLIVFNPTEHNRSFRLIVKSLPSGSYTLNINNSSSLHEPSVTLTSEALAAGIPLDLQSLDHARIEILRADSGATLNRIKSARTARNLMTHAYARLQMRARDTGVDAEILKLKDHFYAAVTAYASCDFTHAAQEAEHILRP
jgi:hypothetical protein